MPHNTSRAPFFSRGSLPPAGRNYRLRWATHLMITEAKTAEVAVVPALRTALTTSSLSPRCSGTRSVIKRSATKRVRATPMPVDSRGSNRCCVYSSIKPPFLRLYLVVSLFLRAAASKQRRRILVYSLPKESRILAPQVAARQQALHS